MEEMKCVYCGMSHSEKKHKITASAGRKGDTHSLYCCGEECYNKMKNYIEKAAKINRVSYILAAVLVVMNLFIFGYHLNFRWMFIPMMGLAILIVLSPSLFVTYNVFEKFGVVKSVRAVRVVGIAIILFDVLQTILWK